MTEIEKKISYINNLNNRITFLYLPRIYESLKGVHQVHGQVMDAYKELVELTTTQPLSTPRQGEEDDTDDQNYQEASSAGIY